MGEWIGAQDKQIAWTTKRFSDNLFVPRSDSFPLNPEKKTLIPYIYNASMKDSFLNSQRKVMKFKFPLVIGTYNLIWSKSLRMWFAQLRNYLFTVSMKEIHIFWLSSIRWYIMYWLTNTFSYILGSSCRDLKRRRAWRIPWTINVVFNVCYLHKFLDMIMVNLLHMCIIMQQSWKKSSYILFLCNIFYTVTSKKKKRNSN